MPPLSELVWGIFPTNLKKLGISPTKISMLIAACSVNVTLKCIKVLENGGYAAG